MRIKRFAVKYAPFLLFTTAFAYYTILCAKTWTWFAVGVDSGDWLAVANMWMVPQPVGSPLFMFLAKFVSLLPGDLVLNMTILLSVLPASATVGIVYLITKKLTGSVSISTLSSLVLLGIGVFLTQATIIEQYATTSLFLALAFYAYLRGWTKRVMLFLGCATAIHATVLVVTLFWVLMLRKRLLQPKPLVVYALVGILPYVSVPIMMMVPSIPPLLADYFSIKSLGQYVFGIAGGIVGNISVMEFPERMLHFGSIIVTGLGLGTFALIVGLRKPYTMTKLLLVGSILWYVWYYVSNIDPVTWTFLAIVSPFLAVIVGLGLERLSQTTLLHQKVVTLSCIVIIVLNGFFLNANTHTNETPLATTYEADLKALPPHTVVVTTAGAYSLGLFYVISQDYDLVPLVYPNIDPKPEGWEFEGYKQYMQEQFGLVGNTTLELVQSALNQDMSVYFAGPYSSHEPVARAFVVYPIDVHQQVYQITGLSGLSIEPAVRLDVEE